MSAAAETIFNAVNVSNTRIKGRERKKWKESGDKLFAAFLRRYESKIWAAAWRGDTIFMTRRVPRAHSIATRLGRLGFDVYICDRDGAPLSKSNNDKGYAHLKICLKKTRKGGACIYFRW